MTPARPTLVRRIAAAFPVVLLAGAALVAVTVTDPAAQSAPRTQPVRYVKGSPITKLGSFKRVSGGVRVTGWAYDPSSPRTALQVFSSVNGRFTNSVIATRNRPAVAKANPKAGAAHGFSLVVPVTEGIRTVCVLARNIGRGKTVTIGCLQKARFDYGPRGRLESVNTRPGNLHLKGWLLDGDKPTAPVTAVIKVDGVARNIVAARSRPDVAQAMPGVGAAHGFDVNIPASQGRHTICVIARNIGNGTDNSFGCRAVTLNDNPVALISAKQRLGKLRVLGWAFDRDNVATSLRATIRIDSAAPVTVTASRSRTDIASKYRVPANRGFDVRFPLAEGAHKVCVSVANIGYGTTTTLPCRTVTLNYRPTAKITSLVAHPTGLTVAGWATDPDTKSAIPVAMTVDGVKVATLSANRAGATKNGHNFGASLPAKSGRHEVCAIGINRVSGTRNSTASCRTITLALSPVGALSTLTRVGDNIRVAGWAYDPDTSAPAVADVLVDGTPAGAFAATGSRPDVASRYPGAGSARGFTSVLTTDDGKHTICASIRNVGGGKTRSLGCRLVIAVHPVVPSAPRSVTARAGYGSLTVSWVAPASDGGAPPTSYTVAIAAAGKRVTVPGTARSAVIGGLKSKTAYRATVTAHNVAGNSAAGTTPLTRTATGPAPQTKPAPVSTSRYVRNIRTCSAPESAEMRRFGLADARRNPSGHRYLMLLDIGGQNARYGGVVLSATTRFVTYRALLACSKAYVSGYASGMRSTAPATIAIGVNNDMDVSAATGRAWATQIVNPLVSFARRYSGIAIAGANDIEPGFSGSYTATRNWLAGYLGATKTRFVFNGSADGCAWTVANKRCNNGWTMSRLYDMAAGMAPKQMINLPQVYNYTMADQWKYISLTGVLLGKPRIVFGGPLTEVTACAQARSCDSISGRSAWQRMWRNLQSHPKLRTGSLPFATDLRIDS